MNEYLKKMIQDMELRGMTEMTKESYLRRVKIFLKKLNTKDISQITLDDIRQYMIYLKNERKLSLGSLKTARTSIKFFFYITLEKDWDDRKVPSIRLYKPLHTVLSKEEVVEIIDSITNLKHKAIISTIYSSGLRVSEVAKIKVTDIDSKNMQIFIPKTKNKHDRYAILSKKNLALLRKYWLECGRPKEWLFPGSKEDLHVTAKTIKNLVLKIKKRLNIKKKISAHTFRHAFACHLLEANVQLPHIQHLLGHRSIKSTTIYLHMTSKSMMNIKSPIDEEVGGGIDG